MGGNGDGGPGDGSTSVPVLSVPEIRDYQRINAELGQLLEAGHRHVRLAGVEGQRLLVSGLSGGWPQALVEVEGRAGPELAAGMNAPGLTVVCRGHAADGAGSGLRAGRVVILGEVGAAVGYAQRGGAIVVFGDSGPRAGLNQSGGVLVLLGNADRLAGERQSGGSLFAIPERLGPHAGRGRRGGHVIPLPPNDFRAEKNDTGLSLLVALGLIPKPDIDIQVIPFEEEPWWSNFASLDS